MSAADRAAQRQVARWRIGYVRAWIFPQHVHSTLAGDYLLWAKACCIFLHRLGITSPQPVGKSALVASLVHRGAAGRTQTALVPLQAGCDGADIGDFARAKPVDVGRAGPPLLG